MIVYYKGGYFDSKDAQLLKYYKRIQQLEQLLDPNVKIPTVQDNMLIVDESFGSIVNNTLITNRYYEISQNTLILSL